MDKSTFSSLPFLSCYFRRSRKCLHFPFLWSIHRWEWRIVFFLGGIGGKIWREMPMRKVCEYFLYIRAYLLRVLFQSLTIFSNFLTIFARCLKRKFLKNPLSRQNKGKEFLDSTFSNLSRILKIDANDVINKTFRCPLEKSCTISPSKLKFSFLS